MSALETHIWNCIGDFNLPFASKPRMQPFGDFALSMKEQTELIEAFDDALIQSKIDAGWLAYLITFMFRPLADKPAVKVIQMKGEVERVYSAFLTRVVRYPNAKCEKPILIGMADLPVPKWKNKSSVLDVLINDGLHFPAILLIPSKSRLKTSVEEHFAFLLAIV